ncbi:protein flp-like isoform X2 [Dreissena polymorpha]|uniref:protein flp-like isoform X2 n=1 Tax=Dreissena polymorpha TaxID=45954 RepID=UPI002264E949|nr:protein flp-like isoform X2 [Dreissena polymorpha]
MDATEVGSKSQAFLENAFWDTTTCWATYCDHTYSIASACVVPNEPSPAYMRSFDDVICDFLREQGVPGASLYVSLNGRPFYQQGYGTSQAGEGVLSSSLMRIASISKVVTAMAVLKLCQERKLELTAQVFGNSGILSGFSACGGSLHITIEDLLRHSAGWDREQVGDHVFWYQEEGHAHLDPWDARQLVQYVLRRDLDFTPGSKHAYSNLGYLVLGMVIEAVSGMTYQEYVNAMLEVLDINDVIVGNTRQQVVHYEEVKYYNIDSKVQKSVFQDEGLVVPQYGMRQTSLPGTVMALVLKTAARAMATPGPWRARQALPVTMVRPALLGHCC